MPDELTIEIWWSFVNGLIATNRYFPSSQLLLLDGIPRTIRQADLLLNHIQVEKIIVLTIDNTEELIKRIQRRALIEKRTDDMDPAVLRTRMKVYEEDTVKILKHYPEKLIASFDADQKPLEVLRDVLVSLSSLLGS